MYDMHVTRMFSPRRYVMLVARTVAPFTALRYSGINRTPQRYDMHVARMYSPNRFVMPVDRTYGMIGSSLTIASSNSPFGCTFHS